MEIILKRKSKKPLSQSADQSDKANSKSLEPLNESFSSTTLVDMVRRSMEMEGFRFGDRIRRGKAWAKARREKEKAEAEAKANKRG